MMRKICSTCLEEYDQLPPVYTASQSQPDAYLARCPKMSCTGHVLEFKDTDVPLLKELRYKGYDVFDLCSGLIEEDIESTAYVELRSSEELPVEPEGFYSPDLEEYAANLTEDMRVYVSHMACETEMDLAEEIIYCQLALMDWIRTLPDKMMLAAQYTKKIMTEYDVDQLDRLLDGFTQDFNNGLSKNDEDEKKFP